LLQSEHFASPSQNLGVPLDSHGRNDEFRGIGAGGSSGHHIRTDKGRDCREKGAQIIFLITTSKMRSVHLVGDGRDGEGF